MYYSLLALMTGSERFPSNKKLNLRYSPVEISIYSSSSICLDYYLASLIIAFAKSVTLQYLSSTNITRRGFDSLSSLACAAISLILAAKGLVIKAFLSISVYDRCFI